MNDINVLPVWQDAYGQGYTGKGVRIAQFEPGSDYSTGPQVFDYRHPELQANVDPDWFADPDSAIPQTFNNHATLVAGVMVAARDGAGAVGVAYGATLSGHYFRGTGEGYMTELNNAMTQYKDYDVVNNSWGDAGDCFNLFLTQGEQHPGIYDAIHLGRNGLGTVIVMAGGNARDLGHNTNAYVNTADRGVITIGAINAPGDISTLVIGQAPFSNPGASILVSAPGSNIVSTSRILMNDNGTVFGDDSATVQGTSLATPIVTGVVALMLEANPNLGWRDVQQILALTARQVNDPVTDTVWNKATNWNGGGMHTSHDYGFGEVDARAAVRLAETWQSSRTSFNERHLAHGEGSLNGAANLNVAINDGSTITRTLSIGAGIRAEHVDVSLDVTHSNWGDLTVELISPLGTVSKLVNNPGSYADKPGGDVGTGRLTFTFDTTHCYGENAQGNWILKITDRSGRGTGTLNGWEVDVYGGDLNESIGGLNSLGEEPYGSSTGDNQYFYTDEFVSAPGPSRSLLTDTNGGRDVVNAAAVSAGATINLNSGAASIFSGEGTSPGRAFTIYGYIEDAYGGDGNDTISGNTLSNVLRGGRGNDILSGGDGVDLLSGDAGNDTLNGGSGNDKFVVNKATNSTDTITDFVSGTAGEEIILVGFDDVTDYSQIVAIATQVGVNTSLDLGHGQKVVLQNINKDQLTEQNFVFVSALDTRQLCSSNLVLGGIGNDFIEGDAANGTYAPGNDWLEGDAGNDTLWGGLGGDLLLGGSGDDFIGGEENKDTLLGATGNDYLFGGEGDDSLFGNEGSDQLRGENGKDTLIGGAGDDYLAGGDGNDLLFLEGDSGSVDGSNRATPWYGMRVGGSGADVFKVTADGGGEDGGTAAKLINGSKVTVENLITDFDPNQAGEMLDLTEMPWIHGLADLTIQDVIYGGMPFACITASDTNGHGLTINLLDVDSSALTASKFRFNSDPDPDPIPGLVTGGTDNDTLSGDAGGNILEGGLGADSMIGRTGDDTYLVDNTGDRVNELPDGGFDTVRSSVTYTLSTDVENLVLTGTAVINGTGNEGVNRITGNSAANTLDGRGGADALIGGAGNDMYVVDNQADSVRELAAEGTDTVQSSVSYALGINIENLQLTGSGSVNATGNDLANILTGNSSDNTLDGAGGVDAMTGGMGDDTYLVDMVGETLTENLDEGEDTVFAAVDYTLRANFENLALLPGAVTGTGNTSDNLLTGNAVNNTLAGLAGADWLDGGLGADSMNGGAGDDVYVVDNAGDTVTEGGSSGGRDTVQTSVTFTLGAYCEDLTLIGSAAINGTGNNLANALTGNSVSNTLTGGSGSDTLDGGAGADTMIGGAGNDIYMVDNAGDIVTESSNNGNDTVNTAITYTLGTSVENLSLTGTAAINATGNALSNLLIGNSANNTLNGGGGGDTMVGGAGNDIYVVNNAGDVVTELSGEGTDKVNSTISQILADNVESLTLTGANATSGTGNTVDNVLTGNSAGNTLDGGAGNDILSGGAGGDTFVFSTPLSATTNLDTITDFVVAQDTIQLENTVFTSLSTAGMLGVDNFRIGTVAVDSNDYLVYNSTTGMLGYDADGSGAGASVPVALLGIGLSLTNADFVVA